MKNWQQIELFAKEFLLNRGFKNLVHNIKIEMEINNRKTSVQIDLINLERNFVRAFEVKFRNKYNSNYPYCPLSFKQYERIINALQYKYNNHYIQLDLIIINKNYTVEHIENICF